MHFTGLTHDERGYPDMSPETHHKLVTRLVNKIRTMLTRSSAQRVLSGGCAYRGCRIWLHSPIGAAGVREARQMGIPVGLLRLISLWPFPEEPVRGDGGRCRYIHRGRDESRPDQPGGPARYWTTCARGVFHAGGEMIPPDTILTAIQEAAA